MTAQITIRGARLHNLKNITLSIPKNQLVVLTGLSGSGKSTLGFDLGPEGSAAGGKLIAQGTHEQVAQIPGSYTGKYLREILC